MTVVVHADVLLDRRALAAQMPAALAAALAERAGGSVQAWELAYRRIVDDWDSYWIDLDLSGDESLAHWREGRWRVTRAHFRVAGHSAPLLEEMPLYLDVLPREVGRRVEVWQPGALDALGALAAWWRIAVLAPFTASSLVWGSGGRLAGAAPAAAGLVAGGDPIPGARVLQPPADLTQLPDLLRQEEP